MRARGGRLRTNRTAAITSFRAVRRGREPGLKVIHPQARGMNHCAAFDTRRMGVAKKQLQILNRSNQPSRRRYSTQAVSTRCPKPN